MKLNRFSTILIIFLGTFSYALQGSDSLAISGVADVRLLKENSEKIVKLDGEWAYYDTVFIDYKAITQNSKYHAVYCKLPGIWDHHFAGKNTGKKGIGYGTYHICLIAPKIPLGLRFERFNTASRIFLNEELILENGVVSNTEKNYQPFARQKYYYFNNESDTLHLVIQVTNFKHFAGGATGPVIIGSEQKIRSLEFQTSFFNLFSLNLLCATALLFFLLYFFRVHDKPQLYFAIMLVVVSLRMISHQDAFIFDWLNLSYPVSLRLDYFTLNLMALSMFAYYFTLYPEPRLRKINVGIASVFTLLALLSFVLPLYELSMMVYYARYLLISILLYAFTIVIARLIRKKPVAPLIMAAFVFFLIFSAFELIYKGSHFELYVIFTTTTVVLFVISQVMVLAKRHNDLIISQKMLADELAHNNLNLERSIQQRTIMLERKNKSLLQSKTELEHLLKTKDKLFSIIGHDLRSPLSIINLYSEILWEECDDNERRKKLNYIINASGSAMHLLSNLLAWGKKETGNLKINPSFTGVDQVIEESVQSFHGIAEAKNIVIKTKSDNSVVYADRFIVQLIISNLLNNAIKFSHPGSEIVVSAQLIAPAPNGKVRISVIDQGVGIDANTLQKLRSGSEIITSRGTNDEKGSGLGLIIVKEFIEMNHGEFFIESEKDRGSIFSIVLQTKMWS